MGGGGGGGGKGRGESWSENLNEVGMEMEGGNGRRGNVEKRKEKKTANPLLCPSKIALWNLIFSPFKTTKASPGEKKEKKKKKKRLLSNLSRSIIKCIITFIRVSLQRDI